MTRLNLVDVTCLTQRHLVAEYKEITQFLHIVKKRVQEKHPMNDLPKRYTLNKGHCLFFMNKGKYVLDRFDLLYNEMLRRGIAADEQKYLERRARILEAYPEKLRHDYEPGLADYRLVVERISLRINQKPDLYPDKDIFFNCTRKYLHGQ